MHKDRCSNSMKDNGSKGMKFLLLGANPTSTNRGVAALGTAAIDNLSHFFPTADLVVACGGADATGQVKLPDRTVEYEVSWLTGRPILNQRSSAEHLAALRQLRRVLPGVGTRWFPNRTFRQILESDAVLDISGGDSFAETYTGATLSSQAAVKLLAIGLRKKLILLPQSFGPFRSPESQSLARNIFSNAAMVATRDAGGLAKVESVFGEKLDNRFLECPDIAFTLRPMPVSDNIRTVIRQWNGPVIGLNVSGLLWGSNVSFGLKQDYQELTRKMIRWAMSVPDSRLILLPHVFNQNQNLNTRSLVEQPELDVITNLAAESQSLWGDRVQAVQKPYSAPELKAIISDFDFFVGARMHACIAAVSSAVPTVILAYSDKARGVMGLIDDPIIPSVDVVDLRSSSFDEVMDLVQSAFYTRQNKRARLTNLVLQAQDKVRSFFNDNLRELIEQRKVQSRSSTLHE